jgi:hypothetical protein
MTSQATHSIPKTLFISNANLSIPYLAASTKAVLITFNGSIIPDLIISTYSPNYKATGKIVDNRITNNNANTLYFVYKSRNYKEHLPLAAS